LTEIELVELNYVTLNWIQYINIYILVRRYVFQSSFFPFSFHRPSLNSFSEQFPWHNWYLVIHTVRIMATGGDELCYWIWKFRHFSKLTNNKLKCKYCDWTYKNYYFEKNSMDIIYIVSMKYIMKKNN